MNVELNYLLGLRWLKWRPLTWDGSWAQRVNSLSGKGKVYPAMISLWRMLLLSFRFVNCQIVMLSFLSNTNKNSSVKPGSYLLRMRMRCEFDVNLTSQLCFQDVKFASGIVNIHFGFYQYTPMFVALYTQYFPEFYLRCDIRRRVEHNSTAANFVNIRIAFA